MTTLTDMVSLERHGEIAVLIVDNPPVNALSRGVRDGLCDGIERADAALASGLIDEIATMQEFRAQHGDHWAPAALLEQLAAEGKRFTDS